MAEKWKIRKEALLLPLLLLGMAVLVSLTTLMAKQPHQDSESLSNRSVYNYGASGYKGWFLASQKAGLPIQSWEESFDELKTLPYPATMLIIKPYTVSGSEIIFGRNEAERLLKWVAQGNTLILLDDFGRYGANTIANRLSLSIFRKPYAYAHANSQKAKHRRVPLAFRLTLAAKDKLLGSYVRQPLQTRNPLRIQALTRSPFYTETLLQDADGSPTLIRVPYREGWLILGTSTDLAQNDALQKRDTDNFQFLSNLLAQEQHPVFVNEFVHGYAAIGDILAYFQQKTPLGAIFAQLVFAFALLLWLSFARWTPKPKEPDERLQGKIAGGLDAYIQSIAGIYYRSQSASLALAPQIARIDHLLKSRHRIKPDEEARLSHLLGNLFADYSNKDESPQALMDTLQEARQALASEQKLSPKALIRLSRQLTLIEERLHYEHRKTLVSR